LPGDSNVDVPGVIKAVSFDATGTLFYAPRLGDIYAEVLRRHGLEVTPRQATRLVRTVWDEFDCRRAGTSGRDRFSSHPQGVRGWWSEFVARILAYLGGSVEPAFVAAELFDRFATPESWEPYPEVRSVLRNLRARGFLLAVVSNWDDRLHRLLDGLGLGPFDAVLCSAEVGFEKPHPAIFQACLAELASLANPELASSECLHVGDRRLEDREGAQAAGMSSVLLTRGGEGELSDLRSLEELLRTPTDEPTPVLRFRE